MPNINYKLAVITGASSGIGLEIAKKLSESGTYTLAIARSKNNLEKVKSSIPEDKRDYFMPFKADIRLKADIKKIIRLCKKHRKIDLLVNNAGVGYSKPFVELSDKEINDTINTNLTGHALLTKGILSQRNGKNQLQVVFVSSLAGKMGFGNLSIYSATKFAIEGLCESLRQEFEGQNVHFTVLSPGVTDTNFFSRAGMEEFYELVKGTKTLHSAKVVASRLLGKLAKKPSSIVVGNDRYFVKLLPFIPFKKRFKVLDFINKL